MIYEAIMEAAERREVMMRAGAYCRWHRRRDGIVVIREIIVLSEYRRKGIGRDVVEELRDRYKGAKIVARCPAKNMIARQFYLALGFTLVATGKTRNGESLNTWEWTP